MELLSVSVVCWIHLVFCLLCFRFKNSWNLPNYISGRNELWLICSADTWIPPASSMAQNGIFSFDVQSYTENFWTLNRSSLTTIQENSEKLKSVVIHLAQIRDIQGNTESIKPYNETFQFLNPKSLMWGSGKIKALHYRLVRTLCTGFSINQVRFLSFM